MRMLRTFFLVATVIVALIALSRAHWEGTLSDGGTWIVDLPRSPVWSPPPVPAYETFRSTFDMLPVSATSAPIRRVFRADWTFLDFTLYLWAVAAVFGIIYLCIHRRPRDPILHVALCLG